MSEDQNQHQDAVDDEILNAADELNGGADIDSNDPVAKLKYELQEAEKRRCDIRPTWTTSGDARGVSRRNN
ncbi:MAG: hypothetical protein R3C03_01755 [Pirellulaceae bacterium]